MFYLINLILSCSLANCFDKTHKKYFLIFIFILWTFIIGGQYDVGTDYFSYLKTFSDRELLKFHLRKKEYLFYYFVILCNFLENKQFIFIIISFIENILFFKFIIYLKNKMIINKSSLFIFLFLCYGTTFYNQMNGIRQYFNTYLLTYLIIYIYNKKILKYFSTVIIGINIHASFLLFSPLILFSKIIKKMKEKELVFILCFSFIITFFSITDFLKEISKYYPTYSHYVYSSYFNKVPFQARMTKIIYLPFYIQSVFLIKKFIDNRAKLFLLKIGILAFAVKLFCLSSGAFNRIGESLGIIILFPIYFLFEDYIKNNKKIYFFILISLIIILYIFKILIFPSGEYLYKSYFFRF